MSVNPNSVPRTPITDARNNPRFRPTQQPAMNNSVEDSMFADYSNTFNPATGTGGSDQDSPPGIAKSRMISGT